MHLLNPEFLIPFSLACYFLSRGAVMLWRDLVDWSEKHGRR